MPPASPKLERGEPPKKETEAIKRLNDSVGELQYLLTKKINIKPMPRVEFALDRGMENAAAVEKAMPNCGLD